MKEKGEEILLQKVSCKGVLRHLRIFVGSSCVQAAKNVVFVTKGLLPLGCTQWALAPLEFWIPSQRSERQQDLNNTLFDS